MSIPTPVVAGLSAALATAKPAPPVWTSGIDLSLRGADVRLLDPATFKRAQFVTSGYASLNDALGGGFALGETTTVFAPSSMGKSSMMANMALNMARSGVSVAILSLEMPECDIWKLLTGIAAQVPRLNLRQNKMTTQESQNLATAVSTLSACKLDVIDRRCFQPDPGPCMDVVGNMIRDGVRHRGWQAVFIDYLTKVGPHDDDEVSRVPRLTNWAFDLAQRTGVHIVALAQSNKGAYGRLDAKTKKRTVSLEDVKGVVEAVSDFDNVIGLVRNDWNTGLPQDPVDLTAVTLKARQGPTGYVALQFYKSIGRIIEPTHYSFGGAQTNAPVATATPPPPLPNRMVLHRAQELLREATRPSALSSAGENQPASPLIEQDALAQEPKRSN